MHHEFIKGTCFELFDYADGIVFIYLFCCNFYALTFMHIFQANGLGYGLQQLLKDTWGKGPQRTETLSLI